MKLKRRFYDASINFNKIPVERLVLGIVIGLVSAFVIYGFFYVIRESFRVMSLGFNDYGFWSFQENEFVLTQKERRFYNIFFSGLSVVLGNSMAILFIFSRPTRVIDRFNFRRKRILNDQVFLSFNFLYWFNKIGLTFGVFSMCCLDFQFLPYFKPVSYLLLLVLYLETWKTLARLFRKNRFRVQILHFIIMFCFTLVLAQIDVVDYDSIDKAALKNNPTIDFPESEFYQNYDYFFRKDLEIPLKLTQGKNNDLEIYTPYREKIKLKEVGDFISAERVSRREELFYLLSVRILADKDLNARLIKMIEAELYSSGIYRVNYEIYNKDFYQIYFENSYLKKRLNKSVLQFKNETLKRDSSILISTSYRLLPPEPNYEYFNTIKISVQNDLKFKDKSVSKTEMVKEFTTHINSNTLFTYEINKTSTYQNYIDVLSAHNNAVNKLKQKEQTIFIENKYDFSEAYRQEQLNLSRKYPVIIFETFN